MDGNIATIICSALTALGTIVVAVITSRSHGEAKATNRAINNIKKDIKQIKSDLAENNLETCRVDLRQAFHHSRDDIPATLELSWRYFVDLHGDADLGPKFLQWVEEYNVRQWAKDHKYPLGTIIKCATHH